MATYEKITDMDAASALDGTEPFEVVQSSTSKKATGGQIAQMVLPAGMILPFGNTTAPTGYLACDGAAVSRTTYSGLFAAIAEVWGVGNGSTTFNVPDFRGAFVRGTGSNGTANMANGNDFAGPSVGSTENDQMQGHYHRFYYNTSGATSGQPNPANIAGNSATTNINALAARNIETDSTNGTPREGDETRPFAAGVLYCIKT